MSVVIVTSNDPEFDTYSDLFYENFHPDDWDFMIMGKYETQVRDFASELDGVSTTVKKIDDMWVAVNYHS